MSGSIQGEIIKEVGENGGIRQIHRRLARRIDVRMDYTTNGTIDRKGSGNIGEGIKRKENEGIVNYFDTARSMVNGLNINFLL